MGNLRMRRKASEHSDRRSRTRSRGFTLLEVLIALCFMTVAAVGCLSLVALVVRTYQLCNVRFKETLVTWNETQELRSSVTAGGESGSVVIPGPIPLRRFSVQTGGEPDTQVWEVLHAKK